MRSADPDRLYVYDQARATPEAPPATPGARLRDERLPGGADDALGVHHAYRYRGPPPVR
jgi:hypothetical protein